MTAVLRPRIAIVGGGFGGLFTALKLAAMPWTRLTRPEISLIDRSERFAFLPMMYELATGEAQAWEVAPRYQDLLSDTPIKFVKACANALTLGDSPAVHLASGDGTADASPMQIPFDRAVFALGCESSSREAVPGAQEHAMTLHSYDDALGLHARLDELQKSMSASKVINVFVVGGGHSGVETASCIADKLGAAGSVVIIHRGDRLLERGTTHNRLAAERALLQRGVAVEYRTSVASVSEDSVSLEPVQRGESGTTTQNTSNSFAADLVVWTTGVKPSSTLRSLGLPLDESMGRITTDPYLQVVGHEDVLYALGDCALFPTTDANGGYSGTAQVAVQQADYAAWNLWASLTGRSKLEYRYMHLGEMLVLGARDGCVSTTVGVEVDGAAAWTLRRAAYLARMPTDRHRTKVATKWALDKSVCGIASSFAQPRPTEASAT